MDNMVQFKLIFQAYHQCMEVVFFWLMSFHLKLSNFLRDGQQLHGIWLTQKLPWAFQEWTTTDFFYHYLFDKCHPKRNICMPQIERWLIAFAIHKHGWCAGQYHSDDSPMWKLVLAKCSALNTCALIDAGGLMAGSKNTDAACLFADIKSQKHFCGVVYFDIDVKCWMVYKIESQQTYPWKHLLSWRQNVLFIIMRTGVGDQIWNYLTMLWLSWHWTQWWRQKTNFCRDVLICGSWELMVNCYISWHIWVLQLWVLPQWCQRQSHQDGYNEDLGENHAKLCESSKERVNDILWLRNRLLFIPKTNQGWFLIACAICQSHLRLQRFVHLIWCNSREPDITRKIIETGGLL